MKADVLTFLEADERPWNSAIDGNSVPLPSIDGDIAVCDSQMNVGTAQGVLYMLSRLMRVLLRPSSRPHANGDACQCGAKKKLAPAKATLRPVDHRWLLVRMPRQSASYTYTLAFRESLGFKTF
jgi:hypothetical protein